VNETTMTLVGNLVDDPTLRRTSSTNIPFANFRVASTSRRFDREQGGFVDAGTLYVTVTAWRGLALNVAASLRKGSPVVVYGRYSQREYTQNDQLRVAYGLEALAVGPDLTRGVASFDKKAHGSFGPTVETDANGLPSDQGDRLAGEDLVWLQEQNRAFDAAEADDEPAGGDDFVAADHDLARV